MKKFLYIFCLLIILLFFVAPQLRLFVLPGLNEFSLIFQNENTLKALQNTFLISLSVGMSCLILGVPLAWLITRTDIPWRHHFRSWFCLPYAIPPFVGAIGWIILANPTSGILNQWFGLKLNIYSFWGLVWVETSFLFTFVLLSALTVFDKMDSSLEEAARLCGAGRFKVFWDVTLPLMKPALLNGFILSFLATASSFGVPAMIGGPARIYMLTTQIYSLQRTGTTNSVQIAIAISAFLGLSTLILLYSSQFFLGRSKNHTVAGKTPRPSVWALKTYKTPLVFLLGVLLFLIFILPLLGLLLSALSSTQGSWNLSQLSFDNFHRVLFRTEETGRALRQSLQLAFSAALFCTLFSFLFNYYVQRTKYKGQSVAQLALSLPFSTPGTVLAFALIISFSQGIFGLGPSLYNTLTLIFVAYVIKYCSLSSKIISDAYQQIHPSLEEAARISGARWVTVMRTIYWPLLKSALMASAFLVFMPTLSELTMTILLTGPGLETIGTLIFQLQEYSDVGGGGAAVLSCLVVLFVLTLNFSLKTLSKGRYGL